MSPKNRRKAYLDEVVQQEEGHDDGQEDGRAVTDDHDGADHGEEGVHPRSQHVGQDVVDRLDISREAVQDAADRGRVEEGHGGAQDVVEQVTVQFTGGPHHGYGRDDGIDQDK